jgi:hypothetical protein
MNNLLLAGIIGAVGAALLSNNYRQIAQLRTATVSDEVRLKMIASHTRNSDEELRRLRKLFEVEQESIRRLRAETVAAVVNPPQENESELTPQKEGFWPAEKPYFYLSKSRLEGLNYWPLTDAEDNLSDTARLLFGMSDEEARLADAANLNMQEKLRQLEIDHAVPTNTPPRFENWPGKKTTLYVTEIPQESVIAIMQEFGAALEQTLGPERAALLARRIDETMDGPAFNRIRGRSLTLIRDGDRIQLNELDGEGNMTSSRSAGSDGREEIPKPFRHLFPSEE